MIRKLLIVIIVVVAAIFVAVILVRNISSGVRYNSQINDQLDEMAERRAEAEETVYTIGETASTEEADFTLLDVQLVSSASFESMETDDSSYYYEAEDGQVLACIQYSYQYTGEEAEDLVYRSESLDDPNSMTAVYGVHNLIDLVWNNEDFSGNSDYCVGVITEDTDIYGFDLEESDNEHVHSDKTDDYSLQQEPNSGPVTGECYISLPDEVLEEDSHMELIVYLPISLMPVQDNSKEWRPVSVPFTYDLW